MLLKGMEFDTTHFITDVSGKYPRPWALKGAHLVTVKRWYKFGARLNPYHYTKFPRNLGITRPGL
ncbi:hypothetical protein ACS0TY_023989 [Phlomoides rotata]